MYVILPCLGDNLILSLHSFDCYSFSVEWKNESLPTPTSNTPFYNLFMTLNRPWLRSHALACHFMRPSERTSQTGAPFEFQIFGDKCSIGTMFDTLQVMLQGGGRLLLNRGIFGPASSLGEHEA